MLSKRKIRENTIKLLFGYEFNLEKSKEEYYALSIDNDLIQDDEDENVKSIFFGVIDNLKEIDILISNNLSKWTINRISKVTLSILRLSVYEMKYLNLAPAISINEAVEISKVYAEDGATKYINGVLNNISRIGN